MDRIKILEFFDKNKIEYFDYAIKINGSMNGVNIAIACCVHGNEKVGAEFAIDFFKKIKSKKLVLKKGSVTFFLANPKAFLKNKRFIEKDLNRSFSKNEDDTYEGQRMKDIRKFLAKNNYDVLIDLHSVSKGDNKILVYNANDDKTCKMLEKTANVELHFLYWEEHVPNTLINEGSKLGLISFLVECGNHNSNKAKDTAWDEVMNVLRYYDMVDYEYRTKNFEVKKYETIGIIKTGENFRFLLEDIGTETFLPKDTVFSYDDNNGEQTAIDDCYVFMPSKNVSQKDFDAGFLCKLKK